MIYLVEYQLRSFQEKNVSSSGGLEPPTFRLTVERANQLRHEDRCERSAFLEPMDLKHAAIIQTVALKFFRNRQVYVQNENIMHLKDDIRKWVN